MIAHMQGEDADAWKYYLKKGMIKEAMNDCSANNKKQRAYVAGIYAD